MSSTDSAYAKSDEVRAVRVELKKEIESLEQRVKVFEDFYTAIMKITKTDVTVAEIVPVHDKDKGNKWIQLSKARAYIKENYSKSIKSYDIKDALEWKKYLVVEDNRYNNGGHRYTNTKKGDNCRLYKINERREGIYINTETIEELIGLVNSYREHIFNMKNGGEA